MFVYKVNDVVMFTIKPTIYKKRTPVKDDSKDKQNAKMSFACKY